MLCCFGLYSDTSVIVHNYYADTSENHFLKSPFAPDLKSLCSLDSKQYYPQMSVVVLGSEEQ